MQHAATVPTLNPTYFTQTDSEYIDPENRFLNPCLVDVWSCI